MKDALGHEQKLPLVDRLGIIGIGLIGSSIAQVARQKNLAAHIAIADASPDHIARAKALGLGDSYYSDNALAVADADLVILSVPLSAYQQVGREISTHLKAGCVVSDTGSVKGGVVEKLSGHLPKGVHLVPGHPVAGTERSGPEAGFADLFQDRWFIMTPTAMSNARAMALLETFWSRVGCHVETMDPEHHDLVFAIVSHVPHLIAYNIVATASDMEDVTRQEVIKYAASGFRDFTRLASSDPTVWRDVFIDNQSAVLEMLDRFMEDLSALKRAIRWGEGEKLFDLFNRTRTIRQRIIAAGQEVDTIDFGRHGADQGQEFSGGEHPLPK